MDESHRVAIITGGARGMGFECARYLARTGIAVAIVDVDGEQAMQAVADLTRDNFVAIGAGCDVRNETEVYEAVDSITRTLGPPAILINAAGILRRTAFLDISVSEWNEVVDVSLKGTFLCSKACLPAMIEREWGRIVNFSSTAGKTVSTLGGAHYTAAKTAVLGLTRALAKESAASGVCVNAVCPGLVDTEMTRQVCSDELLREFAGSFPIPRLGQPWEVASLVGFLCSGEAAYITGAAFDINGGDLMV